MEKRKK